MKYALHLILLTCVITLAAMQAHAREVYKWVDENGKVHYGDAPTGKQTTTVKVPHAPPSSTSSQGTKTPKEELESVRENLLKRREARTAGKEEKVKEAEKQKRLDQNCKSLRDNLRMLQEMGRVFSYNDKGEREFMDDASREKKKAELQKRIAAECK